MARPLRITPAHFIMSLRVAMNEKLFLKATAIGKNILIIYRRQLKDIMRLI